MERRISPSKVSEMILPVVSTEAWPDTKMSSPTRVAGLKGRCDTGVSEDFGYSIIGASPAWCVCRRLAYDGRQGGSSGNTGRRTRR